MAYNYEAYEAYKLVRASSNPDGQTYKRLYKKHGTDKIVMRIAHYLPGLLKEHCIAAAFDMAVTAALKDLKAEYLSNR